MKKRLVIIGDSAFAEIAREYFDVDTGYETVAFSVETPYLRRDQLHGLPVVPLENIEALYPPEEHDVYVAIVYTSLNRLRTRLMNVAKQKSYALASYVSPRSFVWRNVEMGEHCFIFEDNTIQPFVKIGHNVVLWSGNHIGHHSWVHDNCFVSSHVVISGFCEIGENSFMGVNATIGNNVKIGKDNWISPNVTILKDTQDNSLFKTTVGEAHRLTTRKYFRIDEEW
jgi:sugar O-acyltransferase (sialic acid O-acetyltransferase NeuD family)